MALREVGLVLRRGDSAHRREAWGHRPKDSGRRRKDSGHHPAEATRACRRCDRRPNQ